MQTPAVRLYTTSGVDRNSLLLVSQRSAVGCQSVALDNLAIGRIPGADNH